VNRQLVITGIRKLWEVSRAAGIGDIFSNPVPLQPSEHFRYLSNNKEVNYEELYLTGMRYSDYNILLADFSFLQFGISHDEHVRYAYYPNPFLGCSRETMEEIGELREFVEEGIITIEEYLHRISESRRSQHPPLIRYENSPDDYVELAHPCSHFHLGHHNDNRWALQRVLTPAAFGLIVFKLFFPRCGVPLSNMSCLAYGQPSMICLPERRKNAAS
jgi:hypothetical protein